MACIATAFGVSGIASAVTLSQQGEAQMLVYL